MAANIGYATLQVVPSFKGSLGNIKSELSGPLDKAGEEAGASASKSFGQKFKVGLGDAGKLAAGGILAIGAGAVAFGASSVKAFDDVAGGVSRLQRLTGGTAEDMSRLAFEAKESGVSQETLETALKKSAKAMVANSDAFKDLGISTTDANGKLRPMNDVMADVAGKFATMQNGAEKDDLAMKLFGKSGTDMLPMLNKGKDGLLEMGAEADKFGITIGQDSVDAYKKNIKNGREMHAAMEGLKVQIGEKLMPIITKLTTFLVEHLPPAIEFAKRAIGLLTPVIEAVGDAIAWLVGWFQDHWDQITADVMNFVDVITTITMGFVHAWQAIWDTFGDALTTIFVGVWEFLKSYFQAAVHFVIAIFDLFRDLFTGKWGKLWGDVVAIFKAIWDAIKAYVKLALDLITGILEAAWAAIKLQVQLTWDAIKAVITAVWDAIKGAIKGTIDAITSLIQAAWDGIKAAARIAWDGIKSAITGAWDGIRSAVSTAVDAVVGFVTGIAGRIASAVSTMWDGIKTGITTAKDWVHDRIEDVVSFATKLPGRIANAFGGMWDGIKNSFKAALNWIIGKWNGLEFKFPQISAFGVTVGGFTIGLPDIPLFDSGGIVPGAAGSHTLAILEAGERVLTKSQQRGSELPDVTINNYGEKFGVADMNHALAMARLHS